MQGNKTHQRQLQTVKANPPKSPDPARNSTRPPPPEGERLQVRVLDGPAKNQTNQESRDHNKHNRAGQRGHSRQKHSPAEEKQTG
jgi:hypothetical protein